jgi:hypothetical protein
MARTKKLEVPKPSDDGTVEFSELSDADCQRLVNSQAEAEFLVWGMKNKIFKAQLTAKRQQQLEKFVPGWTWNFNAANAKMWGKMPPKCKEIMQSGSQMLIPEAITWRSGRISMKDYYKQTGIPIVVAVG